jgi:hypothetical protein
MGKRWVAAPVKAVRNRSSPSLSGDIPSIMQPFEIHWKRRLRGLGCWFWYVRSMRLQLLSDMDMLRWQLRGVSFPSWEPRPQTTTGVISIQHSTPITRVKVGSVTFGK